MEIIILLATLLWAMAWGSSFAFWEKRSLAPARSLADGFAPALSGLAAASAPFGLLAVGYVRGKTVGESSLLDLTLVGGLIFVVCYLLTGFTFQMFRRLLRTFEPNQQPKTRRQ